MICRVARAEFSGLLTAIAFATSMAAQPASPSLPERLDAYLTRDAKLTSKERAQLLAGHPVTRLLDTDQSHEVAILGAVWVAAPVARYLTAVRDIEQFEKGGNFLVTKKVSTPPRLEDFAVLGIPPDDVADLESCKVGSCELKLGQDALVRFKKGVDWSKPKPKADVDRLAQQLMLEYVNAYLEGGNKELATYRDSSRPTFVGQEFASMVDRMPELTDYLPDLKRYLIGFPKIALRNSDSFIYWQEAKFGLKPTIRINHLTTVQEPTQGIVVSKMLYASHYFWTAIELRVLLPDPQRGPGFWFVSVNRSRSDGLSGFTGTLIRGKVRDEAEKGMLAVLQSTKATLERVGTLAAY
jgi:hypothetical protein